MRPLLALMRKEFGTLFGAPTAYLALTMVALVTAVIFFERLRLYNQILFVYATSTMGGFESDTIPDFINLWDSVFFPVMEALGLTLVGTVPLITMRVFAEERAHGTDELLLTTSIRPWEVALAKHLSTYVFVFLMLAVSAIYPAAVVAKSRLGMEHLLALYTGQLGYGVAVAAIGLACSSLTQSQIVAAVLAYAIPFVILDFTWLHPVLSEGIAELLNELALQSHFDSFARGVIELRRGIYFGGIVALGFTISVGSMEFTRAR